MTYSTHSKGYSAYQRMGAYSGVENATPHRLIQMLLEGALDKIAVALGHMENQQWAKSSHNIGLVISILDGLKMSLDKEKGGEIAENLDALYDYMEIRLFKANVEKDKNGLNEVAQLLKEIKAGWDGIKDQEATTNQP